MNFNDYIVPAALVGCLIVGYCLKNIVKNSRVNDFIPAILAVVGAVIVCRLNGISVMSIITGAVSGLTSTGLHQTFTRFIEGIGGNE